MTPAMAAIVEDLLRIHSKGHPLRLLFDYDGTLAPIVGHPAHAALSAATRAHLGGLSRLPSVRVGILSGRSLGDLKGRVSLPGLDYAGTGGLEWEIEGRSGVCQDAIEASPLMGKAAEGLMPVVQAFGGAWIERKPLAFTVHYRALSPDEVNGFEHDVEQFLATQGKGLRVVKATSAFEISPRLDWNKGSVVHLIYEVLPAGGKLLYAGDSEGDREAMKMVSMLGGLTVGVGGEAPSGASCHLSDPFEVSALLEELLRALRSRDPWR